MENLTGKTTEVDYAVEPDIDLKDRKILTALSKNCRLTPTQIGKMVGLSKDVVAYRVKKLEKKGIIRDYITIVNNVKIGLQLFVVYIQTQNMSQEKEEEFIRTLVKHPATHYVVHSFGKYDFIFDIITNSNKEFDNIIRELLKDFGNYVKSYESAPILVVLKYVHLSEAFSKDIKLNPVKFISDTSFMKELQHMKIDYTPDNIQLDKEDKEILLLLSNKANLQINEMSKKIKISANTIKYRIRNLIKKDIIFGFLPIINISMLGYHNYAVIMELNNIAYEDKAKLFQYLVAHPDVYICLRTGGQYEVTLNVSIKNNLHLHQFVTVLKQKFSKQIKTIEMILFLKDYKMAFF